MAGNTALIHEVPLQVGRIHLEVQRSPEAQLALSAPAGNWYKIESVSHLAADWEVLVQVTPEDDEEVIVHLDEFDDPKRFFRARLVGQDGK